MTDISRAEQTNPTGATEVMTKVVTPITNDMTLRDAFTNAPDEAFDRIANLLRFTFGVARVNDRVIVENDPDKEMDRYYSMLQREYGAKVGDRIVSADSFIDTKTHVSVFLNSDGIPVLLFEDDSFKGRITPIEFFSHHSATFHHVDNWLINWSRALIQR